MVRNDKLSILLLFFIIVASRIPFIFSGYGSEEDAWGLILVARNINLTGIYEVSRMPGHPVQELLLSVIWQLPSALLNFLTTIVSGLGVVFFMLTLRTWEIKNFVLAGIAFAFTPVFYINSSNVMDYTWAISLVMLSLLFLSNKKFVLAGVILGLACGFRITAGAMLIPFVIFLLHEKVWFQKSLLLSTATIITAIVCFIPAYMEYGFSFFTFYEYFPYPPILKNIYKGTIGAWGLVGAIAIFAGLVLSILKFNKTKPELKSKMKLILLMSLTAILFYVYSFIRIPQKAAFIIPIIPFVLIIFSILLSKNQLVIITAALFISCFFLGVNLNDTLRGSSTSKLAFTTTIGNTPVAFDLLTGMVTADLSKRKHQISYAESVVDSMYSNQQKTVVIAGWWQNHIKYFALQKENNHVNYLYFADENELRDSITSGNKIVFLPEQDFYNDLRYKKTFTNKLAQPLIIPY